jgi:hypothetical protein
MLIGISPALSILALGFFPPSEGGSGKGTRRHTCPAGNVCSPVAADVRLGFAAEFFCPHSDILAEIFDLCNPDVDSVANRFRRWCCLRFYLDLCHCSFPSLEF